MAHKKQQTNIIRGDITMKKWETPAMAELNINNTEHEWKIQPSLDGGYFGDGELSGWFGEDDDDTNKKS